MPTPTSAEPNGYRVARTLRDCIESDGTAVPHALYLAFEEFNQAHFGGALPLATILLTNPSSPRAFADHITVDDHGLRFRIRISPKCADRGALFLRDVLLHEMVHAAQNHFDGDGESGYRGHGPKFAARCNAIGAVLGLAPVAARGARSGQPDCAQWPLCVRPAGYYGAEKPKEPKQPKQPRASGGKDGGGPVVSRAAVLEGAMRAAVELLEQGDAGTARARLLEALA